MKNSTWAFVPAVGASADLSRIHGNCAVYYKRQLAPLDLPLQRQRRVPFTEWWLRISVIMTYRVRIIRDRPVTNVGAKTTEIPGISEGCDRGGEREFVYTKIVSGVADPRKCYRFKSIR